MRVLAWLVVGAGAVYLLARMLPEGPIQVGSGSTVDAEARAAAARAASNAGAPVVPNTPPGAPGGSTGGALLNAGAAVGTGTLAAAVGPGSVLLGAATAGIGAGIALLTWGITKKGLFRGGETGIYTNPMRDDFLLQFGPGGWDWTLREDGFPTSGAPRLAAILTHFTGQPDGGPLYKAVMEARTVEQLRTATRNVRALLLTHGIDVSAY